MNTSNYSSVIAGDIKRLKNATKTNQRLNKKNGKHALSDSFKYKENDLHSSISKSQVCFLWGLVAAATLFSSYILYQWLIRPTSAADLIPTIWPTFSEIKQNLQLALNGYTEGYLRTLIAYAVFSLLSLSFIFTGKLLLTSSLFKDVYGILTRTERIALSFLVGSLLFSILWLVLGSLGILNTPLAVTMAIVGASGFIIQEFKGKKFTSQAIPKSDKWFWGILIGFLVIHSTTTIMPQTYSDTLLTHLALPNMYIQNGGVQGTPYNIYTFFPQNTEMLVMWCLLLKSEMAAALIMIGFLTSLLMLTWGFLRRNATALAALAAVVLLWTSPTIVWFAGTIKNDFPSGVFLFAHLCALMAALDSKKENAQLSKQWILLAGILGGGAMGHKFTAIITGFSSLLFLLWDCYRQKSYAEIKMYLIGFGVSILPWVLRSLILTGDPIYPYMNSFLGREMVAPWHSTDMISSTTQGLQGVGGYFKQLIGLEFQGSVIQSPSWGPGIILAVAGLICMFLPLSAGLKIAVSSAFLSWGIHLFYSVEGRYHMGFVAFIAIMPLLFFLTRSKIKLFKPVFVFLGITFVASTLYSSQWNRLKSSLSNMSSGYSQGNYNLQGIDSQASNLRWFAHLINTRTPKTDGVLLAGIHYSHEIKRKLYFSNDRDKQVLIDLAEMANDASSLKDKILGHGIKHILISKNFIETYKNSQYPKFKLRDSDISKIQILINELSHTQFVASDGNQLWLSLSNDFSQNPIYLDKLDSLNETAGYLSAATYQYEIGNIDLASTLLSQVIDVPMNRINKANVYLYLGATHVIKGQVKEGLKMMETSTEMAPEIPGPYATLARFYLLTGQHPERVYELLQKAIQKGHNKSILKEPIFAEHIKNL